MARNWREVRDEVRRGGLVDEQGVEDARKHMTEEVRAHKLSEVRKAQHVSQAVVADAMGVKQPRVSAIERGNLSRTELGTLESYVEALGGKVRIVADFGEDSVTIG